MTYKTGHLGFQLKHISLVDVFYFWGQHILGLFCIVGTCWIRKPVSDIFNAHLVLFSSLTLLYLVE